MDCCSMLRTANQPNETRTNKCTLDFEKYSSLAASGRGISMDKGTQMETEMG